MPMISPVISLSAAAAAGDVLATILTGPPPDIQSQQQLHMFSLQCDSLWGAATAYEKAFVVSTHLNKITATGLKLTVTITNESRMCHTQSQPLGLSLKKGFTSLSHTIDIHSL